MTYCIASHAGGGVLYYNKAMFAAANIAAPPNDMNELLADAVKLNTPDHAGFCVRADKSQTLYDAFQLWNHFIPYNNPITGTYFDTSWNFRAGRQPVRPVLPRHPAEGCPQGHLHLSRDELPLGLPAGPGGDVAG